MTTTLVQTVLHLIGSLLPMATTPLPPPLLLSPKTLCMPYYFHLPQIVMDSPCQHVIWSLRKYSTDWTMAQEELLRNKIIKILLAESIQILNKKLIKILK
jgi:hypothetical protein